MEARAHFYAWDESASPTIPVKGEDRQGVITYAEDMVRTSVGMSHLTLSMVGLDLTEVEDKLFGTFRTVIEFDGEDTEEILVDSSRPLVRESMSRMLAKYPSNRLIAALALI